MERPDWSYIHVYGEGEAILDWVIMSYGGGRSNYDGEYQYGMLINHGDLTLTNSTLSYSGNHGLYHEGSAANIHLNYFYANNDKGVYNANEEVELNAEHNWWGDVSGPDPYGSGDGINYQECYNSDFDYWYICEYYVDADPWIGKQTQESENLIDNALPDDVLRNTADMEPGIPYIKSIDSEHDFFLFGVGPGHDTDQVTVQVDWNGSEAGDGSPGKVDFILKATTYSGDGNTTGIVYDLPTERLKAGFNDIEIVAINAGGEESKPFTVQMARFLAPKWLSKLDVNGGDLEIKVTQKPDYTEGKVTVMFPFKPWGAEIDLPEYVPFIGGENGVPPNRAGFSVNIRSDGKAAVEVLGETEFKLKGNKVKGQLIGQGNLTFTDYDLVLTAGTLTADLGGTIKLRESVFAAIPALAPVAHTPIVGDILDTVYVEGKVQPGIKSSFGFKSSSDGNDLEWIGVTGGGELKVTLALGVDVCNSVDASIYGGGKGGIEFQAPPNPSYLREVSGGFFVGAKLNAFGFKYDDGKVWEYVYEPQATRMMANANTLTAPLSEVVARPVLTGTTDWHIEQPEYETAPYAQFVGNRPAASRAPQSICGTVTTPLVTNLYAQANPALALRDNEALLTWVHDDTALPDSQSKEIHTTWWNGSNWVTPIAVTDNTMSEFNPQVTFVSSDQAMAVWERINDPALPMTATFDFTTTRKMELAYAVFDLNTHTWSAPALLTDNTALDHGARLASGQDDTAMIVWTSNAVGGLIGNVDAPDTLRYALWDGTAWSTPDAVVNNVTGTLQTSLAYQDINSATLVLSLDTDGDFTTTADIELFYTEWDGTSWSSLTQLTDDTVADTSPTVLYTSTGERRLVWLRDGQIHLLDDDWSAAPTATQIESESAGLRDFSAALDNEDNLMLIWQGMSDAVADLYYAFYDADTATWKLESQLTNSNAMEKQFSPAFDPNGQLMVAYALDNLTETVKVISPTLTITGVTEYDSTDLYVLHYTPDTDLTLTDLSLPDYFDNPWPGDSVDVDMTVQNTGDWAVVSPTVALYDGDPGAGGTLITTTHAISGPLAGGASEDVTIRWAVPVTPVQPHTLYAVVDPADVITESVETNNTLTLTTTTPDVAIASVKTYYYDQHNVVPLSVIANNGPVTATNVLVEFRQDAVTGTVQHTDTITELAPYGLQAITTTWDVSGWAEGDHTYYAVVDSGDAIFEVNEDDNAEVFPVKVRPDLVIYSGDVQADLDPDTGGPVTVTVRNWGTADATNVPVTLYEEPVITTGATALYTWTVASLPVDSDGDVQLTTTLDHRPNRLFAIADPGRVITEVTEHNNVALAKFPISHTFRYHDLEGVVPATGTVTLQGDWASDPLTLTGAVGVYSVTVSTGETPLRYRYAVDGNLALLNTVTRTVTPTLATAYDDYRAVTADDVQLIGPATLSTTVGAPTAPITAQVTLANVTPLTGTTFAAEIGYGTSITFTEWTWVPIIYTGDVGSADQFVGTLTPSASGVYSYTVRFDGNWGATNPHSAWRYTDLDGASNGFDLGNVGILTVP